VVYLIWGHYKLLHCASVAEGLEMLSDLAFHEDIDPVGVYNPATRILTWHPENPYRDLQEKDRYLTKILLKAQLEEMFKIRERTWRKPNNSLD
jgi:hypothetical protein